MSRKDNRFIIDDLNPVAPDSTAHEQPAIAYEKAHALTGIAGHYMFPTEPGFDRDSMQQAIFDHVNVFRRADVLSDRVSEFGQSIGTPDLHPEELQADQKLGTEFVRFVAQREHSELLPMLEKLEALNPQISSIRFDRKDTQQLSDVVHGVVSGFNTDDINYWVNVRTRTPLNEQRQQSDGIERKALAQRIMQKLGEPCDWAPCSATMRKIVEQIQDRPLLPRHTATQETVIRR